MCALRLSCSVLAVATVANMRASPGHSWVQGVVRVPLLGPAHNNVRNGVAVIHIVFYFSTSPEFRGGVMGGPMSDPPEWRSEMAAKKRKAAAKRKPAAKKRKTAKKSVAKKAPAKRKKRKAAKKSTAKKAAPKRRRRKAAKKSTAKKAAPKRRRRKAAKKA